MAVKATMYVYGSVQAVGYRVYVKNVAALMGVRGLVRNRGDGSVEIFAEAEKGSPREVYESDRRQRQAGGHIIPEC
jgi:acylphosphatase